MFIRDFRVLSFFYRCQSHENFSVDSWICLEALEVFKLGFLEINWNEEFYKITWNVSSLSLMSLACHKRSYFDMCRIFEILRNIYSFSSGCLCPVGCLSFVRRKKKLCNIPKIRNFVTYQITFLMTCQQHKYSKN